MLLFLPTIILLIDIFVFSIYLICVLKTFGIPVNLSITYYSYERKRKGFGKIFPILLLFLCVTILPIWIRTTINNGFYGMIFSLFPCITIVCLFSVATTARYKKRKYFIYFHYTCAIIAAICAVVWIFIIAYEVVYVGIGILLISLIIGLLTKTLKTCTLFWLEIAAFYAILFTLLIILI